MNDEQRKSLLERLDRGANALLLSGVFHNMYDAASHFDHVINDLGFEGSSLFGNGPYFVICADKVRKGTPPSETSAPYGHSCNNLKGIYGADMYAPAAVQVLRTENATLRRRVKAYAAVALLGWVAVVVMGVAL